MAHPSGGHPCPHSGRGTSLCHLCHAPAGRRPRVALGWRLRWMRCRGARRYGDRSGRRPVGGVRVRGAGFGGGRRPVGAWPIPRADIRVRTRVVAHPCAPAQTATPPHCRGSARSCALAAFSPGTEALAPPAMLPGPAAGAYCSGADAPQPRRRGFLLRPRCSPTPTPGLSASPSMLPSPDLGAFCPAADAPQPRRRDFCPAGDAPVPRRRSVLPQRRCSRAPTPGLFALRARLQGPTARLFALRARLRPRPQGFPPCDPAPGPGGAGRRQAGL